MIKINEFIDEISTEYQVKDLRGKAYIYSQIVNFRKSLEELEKQLKPELVESKVSEFFDEEQIKVLYSVGAEKTEIDTSKAKSLLGDDYDKVVSITETAIRKLEREDKEKIIVECKVFKGRNSDTVEVRKYSAEDKKSRLK